MKDRNLKQENRLGERQVLNSWCQNVVSKLGPMKSFSGGFNVELSMA